MDARSRSSSRRTSIAARRTSPPTATSSTTCIRTCTRRPTTESTGRLIVAGIPDDEFARAIREDPERQGLLYAGTERGVWVSFDDGAHWQSLRRNLPLVPVHDLAVKDGDLVAATHGRGFWILDDIAPLRQLVPQLVRGDAHLFVPSRVYRASFGGSATNGARHDAGPPRAGNPPNGALVYYWLGKAHEPVKLEFLDARGAVIRTIMSKADSASDTTSSSNEDEESELPKRHEPHAPNKAGLNRFAWDLRYPHPVDFQGMVLWAGLPAGARVVPGTYGVRLTVNGHSETQHFTLLADPRSHATQRDLLSQFSLVTRIADTISAANNAVRTIRNVEAQLRMRSSQMPAARGAEYRAMAGALADTLSRIEETIYQVHSRAAEDPLNYPIRLNDKLAELLSYVENGNTHPTAQDSAVFRDLTMQLAGQLRALHSALGELRRVNALLRDAGLSEIVPSTDELTKTEASQVPDAEEDTQ